MKKFITISEEDAVTKVNWDANSNMDEFTTTGIYAITRERLNLADNMPIRNSNPGHTISGKLTVIDSSINGTGDSQDKCITQFLSLSNRTGEEGNSYIRTGSGVSTNSLVWSPWQKQLGMVETFINTTDLSFDDPGILIGNTVPKVGGGLNSFINNGMYSGIFIDENPVHVGSEKFKLISYPPSSIETFVLVVINNYAISGQVGKPKSITQLKYGVEAYTNVSTVKKRVGVDLGDGVISWGSGKWEDVDEELITITMSETLFTLKKGMTFVEFVNSKYYKIENEEDRFFVVGNELKHSNDSVFSIVVTHKESTQPKSVNVWYVLQDGDTLTFSR